MANITDKYTAKVAVITCTSSEGVLLERAIKSVHQQTMSDFVHVLVNNGGDVKTVDEVVKKYRNLMKSRVHVVHHARPLNRSAVYNQAIKSENTAYIAIHDDTASWHPDFLQATTGLLDSGEISGVLAPTDRIYETIADDSLQDYARQSWTSKLRAISLYDLCLDNLLPAVGFVYRRDAAAGIHYYADSLEAHADWDFGLRFMRAYCVELLDESRVLAFDHHVSPLPVSVRGSTFTYEGVPEGELSALSDKLLRDDMRQGGLGIGYMLSERQKQRRSERLEATEQSDILGRLDELEELVQERTDYKAKLKRLAKRTPGSRLTWSVVRKIVR